MEFCIRKWYELLNGNCEALEYKRANSFFYGLPFRTIASILVCVLLILVFWNEFQPQANATHSPANHELPDLRVGILEDSPPYDFYNGDNKLVGMNIDIVRAVGKRMHRNVRLEVISYNRVVMGLLFHQYDVIAAPQSISPYRKTVVHFTQPYLHSTDVLVYHPQEEPVNSLDDLTRRNIDVAVFNGTSYPQFLESHHLKDHMVLYPTQREMFLAFLNGKVRVMMMDEQIARFYKQQQGLPFEISKEPVRGHKEMAFSVRMEEPELATEINQALTTMQTDGTLKAIERQWLVQGESTPKIITERLIEKKYSGGHGR